LLDVSFSSSRLFFNDTQDRGALDGKTVMLLEALTPIGRIFPNSTIVMW